MSEIVETSNNSSSSPSGSAALHVSDLVREGVRVIAFLEDDDRPDLAVPAWPQVAEDYAKSKGIALSDAQWFNVRPRRFANGRPDVSRYVGGDEPWRFETNIALVRDLVADFGYDPNDLPLDI